MTGPNGHGKFILFIRCSTCIKGDMSIRTVIVQIQRFTPSWVGAGNINILLLSNRQPVTWSPYVKQIARLLHFHLNYKDQGEIPEVRLSIKAASLRHTSTTKTPTLEVAAMEIQAAWLPGKC